MSLILNKHTNRQTCAPTFSGRSALRFATPNDGARLLEIYAQYIDTPITFECNLPTAEDFCTRIKETQAEYPYLVWEEDGTPVGYAYAHKMNQREAYQWNAELSVYVDRAYVSRGIGKGLYLALIRPLKHQGVKTVYAIVTVPNEKSEHLHTALGFHPLATFPSAGYKCGAWQDVTVFKKQIAVSCGTPAPFVPITKVDGRTVEQILKPHLAPNV